MNLYLFEVKSFNSWILIISLKMNLAEVLTNIRFSRLVSYSQTLRSLKRLFVIRMNGNYMVVMSCQKSGSLAWKQPMQSPELMKS